MNRLAHAFRLALLLALGVLVLVPGCRRQSRILVPNRVLDRPIDVALACVIRRTDGTVDSVSLNVCDGADTEIGGCDVEESPHLIGFVANSQRNEVGMFRRCDRNGMVDLDPEAPGYNLVPVGGNPSRIVRTTDGCRAVTANWESCDLSTLDLPSLAHYAVGLPIPVAPSSVVTTIVPRRSDGTPLGASPGDLVAVPSNLSLAVGEDPGGGMEDGDTGGTDGGTTTGGDEAAGACSPDTPASVYVTFPACQLVAEVSLVTQRILQSRQLVRDDDGTIQIVDSGTDPVCPVECPDQLDGDEVPAAPVDPDGAWPMALALIEPPDESEPDDSPAQEITNASLFVGGTGTDEIFEIRLEGRTWVDPTEVTRLRLDGALGVTAIRPTPVIEFGNPQSGAPEHHQFLYVIAGDGSTRVVDRDFDAGALGIECDTQVDPTQTSPSACHPIDPAAEEAAPDRRPLAVGPGIRGADGATITDWAFEEVRPEDIEFEDTPFGIVGVVGIGVTTRGRVVLGVFDQFRDAGTTVEDIDPVGLMNVEIRPHMLWPSVDPHSGDPSALPLVADEEPVRGLPDGDRPTQVLSPTFRRIDLAYSADVPEDEDISAEQEQIASRLGDPGNVDDLGGFEETSLYQEKVARVVVRDYRQWRTGQAWTLVWEGPIPATLSPGGRVACEPETVGWEGGTCAHQSDPADDARDDVRILDEGATLCDEGVLAGDKVVLGGCSSDDACGLGQRCLRDLSAASGASGICISEAKYDTELERMRVICEPFISDPCGEPHREYVVLAAKQNELWLGPLDIEPTSYMREWPTTAPGCPTFTGPGEEPPPDGTLVECEARWTCLTPESPEQPAGGCTSDDDCGGPEADSVCSFGRCRRTTLSGECVEDLDCADLGAEYLCIESQCRTACQKGTPECLLAPLPGPTCFAELTSYEVRLRNAFLFGTSDGSAPFYPDRVVPDAEGYCRVDPTVSTLLQSRIPLGADEDETFMSGEDPIPVCPNATEAGPTDPNPCRIVLPRMGAEDTPFHEFAYGTEPVSAIRFSNPYMSAVLDLTSLLDLARDIPDLEDQPWPDAFALFKRSRIPRNYREAFDTGDSGYAPYNDPIVVSNTPLTHPVRVIPAPEVGAAFVVDDSGRGGPTGVRGQVVRILFDGTKITGDQQFLVR